MTNELYKRQIITDDSVIKEYILELKRILYLNIIKLYCILERSIY